MSDPSTPKKRGAPLGNQNALRHGAYARRLPVHPPDQTTAITPATPNKPLSLVREISYLRAYFFRLAFYGTREADPAKINVTVRTLSIAAAAITRLIQTENWLLQASGVQVQPDRVRQAFHDLRKFALAGNESSREETSDQEDSGDAADSTPENPPAETLIPGITHVARQLGIPVSELVASLYAPGPPSDDPQVLQ